MNADNEHDIVLAEPIPPDALARMRWSYGFAVSARLPQQARRAFEAVLTVYPNNHEALYGMGMLAMNQDNLDTALDYFERALAANPSFVIARRFRAVLLARRGRIAEAYADINWCLDHEPNAGATLYAAACVAARAIDQGGGPQALEYAALSLERAFKAGYGREQAATDPTHTTALAIFGPSGSMTRGVPCSR